MTHTNRTPPTHRAGHPRALVLPAAIASLVLLTGCVTALGELDPGTAPMDRSAAGPAVPLDARTRSYLEPFANVGDGAVRKVGSRYFRRCDSHWVETTHENDSH